MLHLHVESVVGNCFLATSGNATMTVLNFKFGLQQYNNSTTVKRFAKPIK